MRFKLSLTNAYQGTKERVMLEEMGYVFKENTTLVESNDEIELKSLEELEAFVKKFGAVVIDTSYNKEQPLLDLEIYNDYRE